MSDKTEYYHAWADAAAIMVASISDPEAADQAIKDLIRSASPAELRTALHAALNVGGQLLMKETTRQAEAGAGEPGPALEYAVAAAAHAPDIPR
ncbi:hypothetical protein PU560_08975 [Georgenia sp. 10Sc9-8]|uniref:ANTAR domain-containing protein n=1 Tax=Georgenia halotolerans TaxID=3028317 RepID=A0ABT5TX13_9MICO|nr:hypothetical protein [Georgenia halotolerans]